MFFKLIRISFLILFMPLFMIIFKTSIESNVELISVLSASVIIVGFLLIFEFFKYQKKLNFKDLSLQLLLFITMYYTAGFIKYDYNHIIQEQNDSFFCGLIITFLISITLYKVYKE